MAAPCAENSQRASSIEVLEPSGTKWRAIHWMKCVGVFGWGTCLPTMTVTASASPAAASAAQSITGTCFSLFQSAVLTNSASMAHLLLEWVYKKEFSKFPRFGKYRGPFVAKKRPPHGYRATELEPTKGFEPPTCSLRMSRSAS